MSDVKQEPKTQTPRTGVPRIRAAAAVVACLLLAGCAASKSFRVAEKDARALRWDQAVINYSKAVALEPGNLRYSVALARAKLKASQTHFEKAKRYLEADQLEFAIGELQQATLLDPGNQHAQTELQKAEAKLLELRGLREQTELERLKDKTRMLGREPSKLNPASNIPIVLKFKDHEIGKIYDALSKAAGLNFLYDAQLDLKKKVSVDLANVPFEKAMDILMMTNKHFFKILDESTLIIAQDTRQKRQEYQDLVIKTFYLSNAEVKDVQTLLRTLLDARKIAQSTQLNAITIRDTPEIVQVAEKIIDANDKAKAELVIDVELLEINRSTLQTLGLNLSTNVLNLTFNGPEDGVPLNNLQLLRQSGNYVLGPIPAVTLDFLRSDSDTKTIAKPQLRVTEGEKANIHIGDRVPIPTTTFNTANTVGGNIVPITSFVYQEIGIIIDLEPRVHHNKEVTLKLRVEVSSLGPSISTGQGISQPQIQTREIETVIRLRDGETNLLAGLIQEVEQQSNSGLPGVANVPFLRRIFSRNNRNKSTTDIVLTLTPHIIRIPDIREEDLKALWIGTEQNIQLSGASRQSAFGAGPFAPPEEGEEELLPTGEEAPEEGVLTPEGVPPAPEEAPPAPEGAPPEAPGAPPAQGQAPPPAPGLTVSQPQDLSQPPPQAPPPAAGQAGAGVAAPEGGAAPGEEPDLIIPRPAEEEGAAEPSGPAAGEAGAAAPGGTPAPGAGTPPSPPPTKVAAVSVLSSAQTLAVGSTITVDVRVENAENLHSVALTLSFNPQALKFQEGMEGDFMNTGGVPTAFSVSAAQGASEARLQIARVDAPAGASGAGTLCTIVFSGQAPGVSTLAITGASLLDPQGRPISASLVSTNVTVQ